MLKPPKTIDEQISLLKSRNIIIENTESSKNFLENNNYYRLMGYAFQFKKDEDSYIPDTKLSTIIGIYDFDKSLRQIIISLLEDLEISFRTKIAYYLSNKYGNECYFNKDIFIDSILYSEFICSINKNIKRSNRELFIKHHILKYDGRFPFWVLVEILSFSTISKFFKNINNADKDEFSKFYYNYNFNILENWIHHFSVIRNICAHYGRIYNKNLFPILRFLEEDKNEINKTNKIFDSLFILNKIFLNRNLWFYFLERLEILVEEYKNIIDLNLIGFPKNYLSKLRNN